MQAALIAMTILGCDDSVTQCHYVASPQKRWDTIAQCDAETEKRLGTYTNVHYPTVIALCQPIPVARPEAPKPSPLPAAPAAPPQPAQSEPVKQQGFAARAMAQARQMLPSTHGLKHLLSKPVHFVSDSYSWVAKRL